MPIPNRRYLYVSIYYVGMKNLKISMDGLPLPHPDIYNVTKKT